MTPPKKRFPIGFWISLGVGVLLGVLAIAFQMTLPPGSSLKPVVLFLDWPVRYAVDWYAHTFLNGNTDQLIPQAILLCSLYWLVLGGLLGLASYGIWRALARLARKRSSQ